MATLVMETRRILAWLLLFVWTGSVATDSMLAKMAPHGRRDSADHAKRLHEQISRQQADALIEVRFVNREKIRGRLGSVTSDGFVLRPLDPTASERLIAFVDVKSLKAIQSTRGKVAVWIVAGVLVAAIVVVLTVYLKFRHNEGV